MTEIIRNPSTITTARANVVEVLHWYLMMQQRRGAKKTRQVPTPISGKAIPCGMQEPLLPQK